MGMAAVSLSACNKQDQPDEGNITLENGTMANADIEALPPDESVGTSSNELVNGSDNPDANDLGNASNTE